METESEFTFDHVHIKCHDLNLVKTFYEKMFDAETVNESIVGDIRLITMKISNTHLIISETGNSEVLEPQRERRESIWVRHGIGHFCFRVKDIEESVQKLKTKGAEFLSEPREIRKGVKAAFIRAPEGDVIEIVQRNNLRNLKT